MRIRILGSTLLVGGLALLPGQRRIDASSHREAPFISKNPKVDATDFYMFNSYESGRAGFVTLIANYLPLQDRYGGPNYFPLDPEALYEIHIDNNSDANEDLTFQFQFDNALKNGGDGLELDIDGQMVAVPFLNIGTIDEASNAALNVDETYTLKVVRGDRRTGEVDDVTADGGGTRFAKPVDNIGQKSIPDYAAYAAAHIHDIDIPGCAEPGASARVFVGQRDDGFAVNLGRIFDLVNLNPLGSADQGQDALGGKNVTTLALELPASCLNAADDTVIGGWTTASVRQARVINPDPSFAQPAREGGAWAQVSRLGSPLVNEVVIGLRDKDAFNSSEPSGDGRFATYVTHPTLPAVLEILFAAANVDAPTVFPRADLVAAFLTGVTGVNATDVASEMLRLNTALGAPAAAAQNNLGAALCFDHGTLDTELDGCDPAGFPNGRRPGDDVVDIALRVAMGYLLPEEVADDGQLAYVDGALVEATQFDEAFPYLVDPIPGSP
jgi:hypothetical protein